MCTTIDESRRQFGRIRERDRAPPHEVTGQAAAFPEHDQGSGDHPASWIIAGGAFDHNGAASQTVARARAGIPRTINNPPVMPSISPSSGAPRKSPASPAISILPPDMAEPAKGPQSPVATRLPAKFLSRYETAPFLRNCAKLRRRGINLEQGPKFLRENNNYSVA